MIDYNRGQEIFRRAIKSIICYFFDPRLSQETLLQKELEERDLRNPGWDEEAHRASLRARLEDGADRNHLVRLYGEDAVNEEESRLIS